MKKTLAIVFLAFGLMSGASAYAQQNTSVVIPQEKTQQVIASIPSLQSISIEIADFQSKIAGQKESYPNANADLKALKMKYAAELKTQISAHQDNQEIVTVLTEELTKTNTEIEQLK